MHELAVLESIHPPKGPAIAQLSPTPYHASTFPTEHSSGAASKQQLESTVAVATVHGNGVLANANSDGADNQEGASNSWGSIHTDGSSSPQTGSNAGVRKSREMAQWPSESTILVAVRVRPFSPAERAQLPQASTNKFSFSADASLSSGHGTVNNRGDSHDLSGIGGGAKVAGIRKVVDVLDESVLVFDAPDAESISKYKRALLPVQAYRRFKDMRYAFDRVFHEDSEQQEVFENTTRHLIDGVLNGYNGTLFAYGATGCGKTHTISGTPEKPGIIFLTMQELYERMRELEDEKTIEISVSYLEVYNETIRDLLAKVNSNSTKTQSLHLREDSTKRITIAGLSEHHPKSMDELMELVFKGNGNRTISPTAANATSSRSHAVLQINICQRLKTADVSEDFTLATLSLIDLAGSERASATKNRGSRLIEGANINKSLLALGNCINALCDNKPKAHIPYRDSKLTRLLKFSLGGNCKTVMIACVSPSSKHYEETHNTLKYANRAKNIKTKVTKNTLNVDRHVSEYVQAIYELRQEVADLKSKLHNQAQSEGIERAQQKQAILTREFEETVRKMRATFQTARSQEMTYAQLQSQLFIASARLSGLYRWRAGFEEASQAAQRQSEKLEQERELRVGLGESADESAAAATRARKLGKSLSASSSYITMVDQLIDNLNAQTVVLTMQMQEHEDALKLYAVSIQSMERKDNPVLNAGFPFQRLYELEKKCQALESHNKILTTKLELSDKSLSDQFLATDDFMELSARSLVGLRSEIEAVEQAGMATKTLNDIYMASITSFTDMTTRVGTSLPNEPSIWNSGPGENVDGVWQNAPSSPFKREGMSNTVGLNGSKMMSILPEVPQTPVKRHLTSNVLPNLSMDTVDTNLALGSSSLFGSQSPIRMYQERSQLGGLHNPFQVPSLPVKENTASRRRSSPMAGLLFSPKRRRVRGGLRQPRATPPPVKRSVNFLLDIVAEDEDRYTTGLRDPSLPPIRPVPFPTLSSSKEEEEEEEVSKSSSTPASMSFSALPGRVGMGGGAKRLKVSSNTNGTGLNSQGGARRLVVSNVSLNSTKGVKGNNWRGAQRLTPASNGSPNSSASSISNAQPSPTKRSRLAEIDGPERGGKRLRVSSAAPMNPIHGISAATAARIARRRSSAMAEFSNSSPADRDSDTNKLSPQSRKATTHGKHNGLNSSISSKDPPIPATSESPTSGQASSRIPVPKASNNNNTGAATPARQTIPL